MISCWKLVEGRGHVLFIIHDRKSKFWIIYDLIEFEIQTTGSVQAHVTFAYWKHFPELVAIDPATTAPCINKKELLVISLIGMSNIPCNKRKLYLSFRTSSVFWFSSARLRCFISTISLTFSSIWIHIRKDYRKLLTYIHIYNTIIKIIGW